MSERHIAAPATDQTDQQHPDLKPDSTPEKRSRLDLSPVQVMGGALAAMTAAGLGSRFSVEGTVVGAALASVIAAVASALYTASLRHTSAAVRGALGGRRSPASAPKGPSARKPAPTGSTAVTPKALATLADPTRRRTLILSSVLGAVAIFVLAGGVLTMYEAIAGQALAGGRGTTISQVQQEGSENRRTDDPAPAPTDSTEPSELAEPTPTAESSDTAEAESAPTDEPSAPPSAEPSVEPPAEPSAQAEPSANAERPSEAPSQPVQTPR